MNVSVCKYVCVDPIKGRDILIGGTLIHQKRALQYAIVGFQTTKVYCVNRGISVRCTNNWQVKTTYFLQTVRETVI